MKHDPIASGKRKPVNPSIDIGIVAAAREAGGHLSKVNAVAPRQAASEARDIAWKKENHAWLEAHRQWVESKHLRITVAIDLLIGTA